MMKIQESLLWSKSWDEITEAMPLGRAADALDELH
jgi:hypothetical protein